MPSLVGSEMCIRDRIEKIEWGPNWEEILGGEFAKRSKDYNFEGCLLYTSDAADE